MEVVMNDIIRIIIKGGSGYGSIDETYEDRLVITSASISYECKPHPLSQFKEELYRKWSYKTTNSIFALQFNKIVEMTPSILHNNEKLFATDIGPTIITVTYADKHRETVTYFCPNEFLINYFREIKKMIPETEYIPEVLVTKEDIN